MTPEELKQWRAELGWSQQTAADRLGVTLRTYKYYEFGSTSAGKVLDEIPKAIAIAALALRFARDVEAERK